MGLFSRGTHSHPLDGWTVRRPFLAIGLAAVAATPVALAAPWWVSVPMAGLAVGSCLLVRRTLWRLVALAVTLFLLCATLFRTVQLDAFSDLTGRTDTVTGRVVELPRGGRMVTLEVTRSDLVPPGTRMGVFFPDELAPALWETVTVQVTLNAQPFSNYQPGRGVFLCGFPKEFDEEHIDITEGASIPLGARINDRLYAGLRRALPQEAGGVLAALCLGRDEGVLPEINESFRESGLSHLLVVSGLHLSLVVLAMRRLLRRFGAGQRWSALLTIPVMALFMLVVGASPSVMRAGLMSLCWLVGRMGRRRSDGLNALGLAASILLLINPYQLYHVGFQLSFLATAGVLCLTPMLCGWLYRRPLAETRWGRLGQRAVSFVYSAGAVCVSAMLFTLPVQCYYFGGFTVTAPLSNLLAVVPAGWVLLVGWLGLLCCAIPLLGWLGTPLLWVAGVGADYLVGVARLCRFPWAWVEVSTQWQCLLVSALCLLISCALLRRLSWRRWVPPVLALAVLALSIGHWFTAPALQVTVGRVSGGTAVLIQQEGHAALLLTHSQGLENAADLVEEMHCDRLDWVLIQKGEAEHVGDLNALWAQTGSPQVRAVEETGWAAGSVCAVERLNYRPATTLWEGCTVLSATKTWWRVQMGNRVLMLGRDARIPCPTDEGLAVYTGIPQKIRTPAVIACTQQALEREPVAGAENLWIVTDDWITFTAQEDGEWSVLPWQ